MAEVGAVFPAFLAQRSAETLTLESGATTPRRFSSLQREHRATRQAAGLFDFSFMCCIEVSGAASLEFLQFLQTRTVAALGRNRIAYTLLLRDDASVLIDATVWRIADDRYWLFAGDLTLSTQIAAVARNFAVQLIDRSRGLAVMAVQGPVSHRIVDEVLTDAGVAALPYFGFTKTEFSGAECRIARIGYSGESGYELIVPDAVAAELWVELLAAGEPHGMLECGFDAADTLRMEAGHILYSRELAAHVTPAELGMARLVDNERAEFRGAPALRAQRWRPPARRLTGLLPQRAVAVDATIPACVNAGDAVVTSVCRSPLFEREIALGFVHPDDAYAGTVVRLAGGARAQVVRLPFYDPARVLPRRPL